MVEQLEARVQPVLTPALRQPTMPVFHSSRPKVTSFPVALPGPRAQAPNAPGMSRLFDLAQGRLETRVFRLAPASQIESAYYPARLERGILLDAIA